MTPQQVAMYYTAAVHREGDKLLAGMNANAAGAAAAFTGQTKPLEEIERAVRGVASPGRAGGELGKRLRGVASKLGVGANRHGIDSR